MNKTETNALDTLLFKISLPLINYMHTRDYKTFVKDLVDDFYIEYRDSTGIALNNEFESLSVDPVVFDEKLIKIYNLSVDVDKHIDIELAHCGSLFCSLCCQETQQQVIEDPNFFYNEANIVNLQYVHGLINFIYQNGLITPLDKLDLPAGLKEDYALILNKLFETSDIKQAEKELGYWQDAISSDTLQKVLLLLRYDYLNQIKQK